MQFSHDLQSSGIIHEDETFNHPIEDPHHPIEDPHRTHDPHGEPDTIHEDETFNHPIEDPHHPIEDPHHPIEDPHHPIEDPHHPIEDPHRTAPTTWRNTLGPGERLRPGNKLLSNNRTHSLTMGYDGNLVLSTVNGPIWDTGTRLATFAEMQGDGNFVLYNEHNGQAQWHTGTWGNPGARLVMQDDRNLVIYGPDDGYLWDSGTDIPGWDPNTNPCVCMNTAHPPGAQTSLSALMPFPPPRPGLDYSQIMCFLKGAPSRNVLLLKAERFSNRPEEMEVGLTSEVNWNREIRAWDACKAKVVDSVRQPGPSNNPNYMRLQKGRGCTGPHTLLFSDGFWDFSHFDPSVFWRVFGGRRLTFFWMEYPWQYPDWWMNTTQGVTLGDTNGGFPEGPDNHTPQDHGGHTTHEDHSGHTTHEDHSGHTTHEDHSGHEDHGGHTTHEDHSGHTTHEDHSGHEDHGGHTTHEDHSGHTTHEDHGH